MTDERIRRKIDLMVRQWLLRLARRGASGYTLAEMTEAETCRAWLPAGKREKALYLLRTLDRLNTEERSDKQASAAALAMAKAVNRELRTVFYPLRTLSARAGRLALVLGAVPATLYTVVLVGGLVLQNQVRHHEELGQECELSLMISVPEHMTLSYPIRQWKRWLMGAWWEVRARGINFHHSHKGYPLHDDPMDYWFDTEFEERLGTVGGTLPRGLPEYCPRGGGNDEGDDAGDCGVSPNYPDAYGYNDANLSAVPDRGADDARASDASDSGAPGGTSRRVVFKAACAPRLECSGEDAADFDAIPEGAETPLTDAPAPPDRHALFL